MEWGNGEWKLSEGVHIKFFNCKAVNEDPV